MLDKYEHLRDGSLMSESGVRKEEIDCRYVSQCPHFFPVFYATHLDRYNFHPHSSPASPLSLFIYGLDQALVRQNLQGEPDIEDVTDDFERCGAAHLLISTPEARCT